MNFSFKDIAYVVGIFAVILFLMYYKYNQTTKENQHLKDINKLLKEKVDKYEPPVDQKSTTTKKEFTNENKKKPKVNIYEDLVEKDE